MKKYKVIIFLAWLMTGCTQKQEDFFKPRDESPYKINGDTVNKETFWKVYREWKHGTRKRQTLMFTKNGTIDGWRLAMGGFSSKPIEVPK